MSRARSGDGQALLPPTLRTAAWAGALLALLPSPCSGAQTGRGSPAPARSPSPAGRQLILCIGDGMGWGALSAAALELVDARLLSGAEAVGAVATGAYDFQVTDSAAAATAMATGRRTRNGWLSLDPESRAPLSTIAEEARRLGRAVGLVTTSSITHATPAAFASHVLDREQNEEIALQMSRAGFDLLAGGGRRYFLPRSAGGLRADGRNLLSELEQTGVAVTQTPSAARAAPATRRVLLLYAEEDPPAAGPSRPPLEELVDLAIERLSSDPEGFFLMVEGAQIDWAEHDRDARALTRELADFDRAVRRARLHAAAFPRAAVVVVADHDTGAPAPLQRSAEDTAFQLRFLTDHHTALLVPLLVNGEPALSWARVAHLVDLGGAMQEWLLGSCRSCPP